MDEILEEINIHKGNLIFYGRPVTYGGLHRYYQFKNTKIYLCRVSDRDMDDGFVTRIMYFVYLENFKALFANGRKFLTFDKVLNHSELPEEYRRKILFNLDFFSKGK